MDRLAFLIGQLEKERHLSESEWIEVFTLLDGQGPNQGLQERARAVSRQTFGNKVYMRGLIEFTNYCRNNCYYCGIRAANGKAVRYRLSLEEILQCCRNGYELGFRTFVLQGGEDSLFSNPGSIVNPGSISNPGNTPVRGGVTDPGSASAAGSELVRIVRSIKENYPDCAVTLSVGELSREQYQALFDAGADRYLLRHETADPEHYSMLHPGNLSLANRKRCLWDLKDIGFQVGTGFMVGSPGQTPQTLARDMLFIEELQPEMVGIGPFVPHHDTPFAGEPGGSAEDTINCISLLRLMLPQALLPATTALGTIDPGGREKGILAGANVVMPNLSPEEVREKYELYDNKISTGAEAAEGLKQLTERMEHIGYRLSGERGDHPSYQIRRKETSS